MQVKLKLMKDTEPGDVTGLGALRVIIENR